MSTISKELKVLFLLPVLLGIIVSTFYIYYINLAGGNWINSIEFSLFIGVIYTSLETFVYHIYRKYYVNKLFDF